MYESSKPWALSESQIECEVTRKDSHAYSDKQCSEI